MSALYEMKRRFQRKLPKAWQHRFQEAIYVLLYRVSPARKQNFFNSGYAPALAELEAMPPFDREPLQATLYDVVLRQLVDDIPGARGTILDIGCGLGGGIRLASVRYPESKVTGVDINATAVKVCRKRMKDLSNVTVTLGNGRALPLPDAAFDFIFSVGAASYISLPEFLQEASRVLKPGGTLSFSVGYTDAQFEQHRQMVENQARKAGLTLRRAVDITENVFAAIAEDTPRRQALIDRVPWPFRGYALNWADMPGTPRYQEYADGRRLDYAVVCTKDA
ncbi:class I SAM-dependent methyltransferase [Stappia taiwanensis]|uniref:Class I SAM-dependent methyltransferase n=1 Tax=Stappia taiwanensis TaxID=992267 RepID=A0A838XJK8_9HYPH|nr:class I SAM-dependent methyltransferase [Stappia taiwanensis]MBA4610057.1 class I SAM-dependent methyltransferase [Stappia taiwanensis]GGE76589.1 putative methyltransferase [Stappia taiwanensis]